MAKKERRVVGKCISCHRVIYSDQSWEVFDMGITLNGNSGPIHKRCRNKYLTYLVKELWREVKSLERLLLNK